jgi:hypothetical protein
MDEAVLRIVLQDQAQGATNPSAPAGSEPAPQPAQPEKPKPYDIPDPRISAGMDKRVEMQDYAHDILAGAQVDLEKFQDKKKDEKFDPVKVGKALLKGDIAEGLAGFGVPKEFIEAAVPGIGIALLAKAVLDKVNAEVIGGIKSGIGTVGDTATSIASVNQDVTVPIAQLGDAASSAGEKVAGLMPVVGYFAVAIGESGKALSQLMQAIDATAKHYEESNVNIAMASAQAEVRQTMRDMQRGQLLGNNLGTYVTAKSKLENDVEDIKARLLDTMMPLIITIVQSMDTWVKGLEKLVPSSETASTALGLMFPNLAAAKILLDEINRKTKDENEIEDPTAVLFRQGALAPDVERP